MQGTGREGMAGGATIWRRSVGESKDSRKSSSCIAVGLSFRDGGKVFSLDVVGVIVY